MSQKQLEIKINRKLLTTILTVILTLSICIPIISSEPLPPPNHPPEILYKDASPNPADVGESVRFEGHGKDLENGTIYWTWEYGDGGSTSGQGTGYPLVVVRFHTYTNTGTYRAWFNITDMGGKKDNEYIDVTVTNSAPNTPNTPSGPTELDSGVSGTYSTSASDPEGHQVQYQFDWDADGSHDYSTWTSLGSSGHTGSLDNSWSTPGTYVVKSKSRDEYGLESSWSNGLTVTVSDPNQPPVADANGPYNGDAGTSIQLDGSGSYDPDGTITNYDWDLDNDGQYDDATGETPSYTWSSPGTYDIGLQVTDDNSATDTDTSTVYVNDPPVAEANGPYYANEDEEITFDGTASTDSDGTIDSYEWDFGDGNTGTGETPTHTYTNGGEYTVILTVTDDTSSTDTDTTTAYINIPPTADAGGTYTGEPDETITLDGSDSTDSDGTITSYEWDLDNDGQYDDATGETTTKSWSEPGEYYVGLKVTDDKGSTDTDSAFVIINEGNQPPTLEITSPTEGQEISGTFTITGTASDNNGDNDIQYIMVKIDDGSWEQAAGTTNWDYEWDTNLVDDGEHIIYARAYDQETQSNIESVTINVKNTHDPGEPDLEAEGSLSWTDIKPETEVTGSFIIKNIGDEESLLDWEITDYPQDWGTWTFTPSQGTDLSPADGEITIEVTVIAPKKETTTDTEETKSNYEGNIKIVNSEDPTDNETIQVTLSTSKQKEKRFSFLQNTIFYKILERFLYLFKTFNNL